MRYQLVSLLRWLRASSESNLEQIMSCQLVSLRWLPVSSEPTLRGGGCVCEREREICICWEASYGRPAMLPTPPDLLECYPCYATGNGKLSSKMCHFNSVLVSSATLSRSQGSEISRVSEWSDNRLGVPEFQQTCTTESVCLTMNGIPALVQGTSADAGQGLALLGLGFPTCEERLHSELNFQDCRLEMVMDRLVGLGFPTQRLCKEGHSDMAMDPAIDLGCQLQRLCEVGQLDLAMNVLTHMDQQGILLSVAMYRSVLKACKNKKALHHAKRVHVSMSAHGLESTGPLGEYLVSTLVKCGGLVDALQVFHVLQHHRTTFSWTAAISGYVDGGDALEALNLYRCMRDQGVEPDQYTFVSLLKACSRLLALEEGKALHAQARMKGLNSDVFLGTALVSMYGKCGDIAEAENVFWGLSGKEVQTWNAMLSAYMEQDERNTLKLCKRMQEEGVSPNRRTFVIAFQACCMLAQREESIVADGLCNKLVCLEIGRAVHADARRKGFYSDVFVGSILVSMYGKCGSIVEAENVFAGLLQRDVVLWNAMLSAYVEYGDGAKALHAYRRMLQEDVSPDDRSFVFALQACCMLVSEEEAVVVEGQVHKSICLHIGQTLHDDARRTGLDSDVFVCSALVSMYGSCGSIMKAESILDGLSHGYAVPRNALLSAYVDQGQGQRALELYRQMQQEGMSLNARTFVIALQACCMIAEKEEEVSSEGHLIKVMSLEIGQALHADARREGLDSDGFVCITLMNLYGKCRKIVGAENVFSSSSQCNVGTWNAMLSAYVEHGEGEQALQFYKQMQEKGVGSDEWTFVFTFQACCKLTEQDEVTLLEGQSIQEVSLIIVQALHADAKRKGFDSVVIVGSALVNAYGQCGNIAEAEKAFGRIFEHDVVSWNGMLSAYVEMAQGAKALQLYRQMQERGMRADERTFVIALQACCVLAEKEEAIIIEGRSMKAMSLKLGQALHEDARRKGMDSNTYVGTTLVCTYGKCGSLLEAEKVFGGLFQFDAVPWTTMLSAYVEEGQGEKALRLYRQMQEDDVTQDDTTLVCVLQACKEIGSVDICREIHFIITSNEYHLSLLLATTLIHVYGICASMLDAQAVFDTLLQPDVVSWNALIAGYARGGDCEASLGNFDNMQLAGIKPNGVTFLSLLSAYGHAGLVDKSVEVFESMRRDYGLCPGNEHNVSVIDLLGRAGDFVRMEDLLLRMPMQPEVAMWSSLLVACRKHGNVELGKQAFDHAVQLHPQQASASYVLMSNIVSDHGLLDGG